MSFTSPVYRVADLADGHIEAGVELEAGRALLDQHAQAVEGPAAGGFGVAEQLGLLGVVNDVGDDEFGPEHGRILYEALAVHRLHAHAGGVREDVAPGDALAQGLAVVEVGEAYLARGRGLADGLEVRERPVPEGVALIEYAYLLRALEGGLDGDGAGRAARAEERDGLPRYLHAAPAQLAGVAHAVGDVAAEPAVPVYNGVDGAYRQGRRADLVEIGYDRVLERHGHVRALEVEGADGRHGVLHVLHVHVEGEVGAVEAVFLKAVVVHRGGF